MPSLEVVFIFDAFPAPYAPPLSCGYLAASLGGKQIVVSKSSRFIVFC
jgi:hypothetical protein